MNKCKNYVEQVNFRCSFGTTFLANTNISYRGDQDASNQGPSIMFPVNKDVLIKAIVLFLGPTNITNFSFNGESTNVVNNKMLAIFSLLDANGQPYKTPVPKMIGGGAKNFFPNMQAGNLIAGRNNAFNKVLFCDTQENGKDLSFLNVYSRGLRIETVSTDFKVPDGLTKSGYQINGFIWYEVEP